ncbi:hypothetical protein QR680_012537 [Steinernema hermaphroditum]|uniref:SPT2 homolog N-terminal domain-containing protein n=1 Tax=Steinernema hermaphroditum TaxID=289476 RepID=A0AA39I4M2_9BILA|nr:hypothetical protein QR680_012537 [Steinernema hermaphroditum]
MDFDFQELLREAGSNNRHASQRINKIDDDSRRDQQKSMKSLATQRKAIKEELRRRAPPPPEPPKFVIPKKKKEEESKVNDANIQAFLRRKEEEKQRKMRQEREDREELIKHRMKESGGRASKKIAKHFGMNALDMQKKYGNDRDHEAVLERNAIREQEEHDRLGSELRSGVHKALVKNREALNKHASLKTEKQEPFRVGTRKSNSICGLNSRNSKGESYKEPAPYVPSQVGDKRKSANNSGAPLKKRPAPPSLDFGLLMQHAKQNEGHDGLSKKRATTAKEEDLGPRPKAIARPGEYVKPKPSMKQGPSGSRNLSSAVSAKQGSMPSSKMPSSLAPGSSQRRPEQHSKISDARKMGDQKSLNGRADMERKAAASKVPKKSAPPEPHRNMAGVLVPGKRYLPTDVRYKAALAAGLVQPQSAPRNERLPPSAKVPGRMEKPAGPSRPLSSSKMAPPSLSQVSRKPMSGRDAPRAPVRERDYDRPRGQQIDRRRDYDDRSGGYDDRRRSGDYGHRPANNFMSNSDDEYGNDYDDEYDSEMDDFIDDTEVDDFQQRELEDTLKLINRNYDKKRWRYNEMTIDERQMSSSFRDISQEEMRSAKIGMYEDIMEAKRGSTAV